MAPITFNPQKILAYLQRHSPVNTFRLSRHLEIDRGKLIDIIKDLANEGLVKFEHGSVSIIEKSNQISENKEEKPADLSKPSQLIAKSKILKKKKRHKKARAKKKAKKVRTKRIRLSKEKQEALEWIRLAKLDIEKLKIEIRLLSLSPNPEKIMKLRDSAAKLRNMIDWRMREK